MKQWVSLAPVLLRSLPEDRFLHHYAGLIQPGKVKYTNSLQSCRKDN